MRRALRSAGVLALAAAALAALSAPARADVFEAASLASQGLVSLEGGLPHTEQALYAHDPAVSADGRYVVFDGYLGGRAGVWRRELQPPYRVEPVAVGLLVPGSETCVQGACDAELPSVSADGRFVSFTTSAQLLPGLGSGPSAGVWVRDMSVPEGTPCSEEAALHPAAPCPFALASAVDGGTQSLTYAGNESGGYGAVAAGRSAISADGSEVAFVTTAPSDLAGPETPPLQVAVRHLDTGRTELVSSEYNPATGQDVPGRPAAEATGGIVYGAVYAPGSQPPRFPFSNRAYRIPPPVGASISADGSTVAWLGRSLDRQAQLLPGESVQPTYSEPLWRRIADGPTAPTRRVTGGSQPEAPGCAESGERALPAGLAQQSPADPCQGPFAVEDRYGIWAAASGDVVPQVSADGYTVAFIASAQPVALGIDFGRSAEGEADDIYVGDMHPGLSRTESLHTLTALASGRETDVATAAPIVDFAVSPDGSQVAFATQRTQFLLPSPSFISPPSPTPGMAELFDVDLAEQTLTRVTRSTEGGASERPHGLFSAGEGDPYKLRTDGALSPSFSGDGNILAFASTASNLVAGDANTPNPEASAGPADGSDVFVVPRVSFQAAPADTYVSPKPLQPGPEPPWRLYVTAVSLGEGRVRLLCETPGAGVVTAYVEATVPDTSAASVARAASRHRTRRARVSQMQRYVATGNAWPEGRYGGFAPFSLTLGGAYSSLASRPGGLQGLAHLTFIPRQAWRPVLHLAVPVRFVRTFRSPGSASRRRHRR